MRARATRRVNVTNAATQIRDTTDKPVTYSIIRYDSSGGNIQGGAQSTVTYGTGETIQGDSDFVLKDQSLLYYLIADVAGPISVEITDYEA